MPPLLKTASKLHFAHADPFNFMLWLIKRIPQTSMIQLQSLTS